MSYITDQPGRVFAVFIFAPILFYKGVKYKDNLLIILGRLLFLYDLFWLIFKKPCKGDI